MNTDLKYFLAGYHLIKLNFAHDRGVPFEAIYSCSNCLNECLLGFFARSWTCHESGREYAEKEFGMDPQTLDRLHAWTEAADEAGKTGTYDSIFYDVATAREYQELFFANRKDIVLLGLYLPEPEVDRVIRESLKEYHTSFSPPMTDNDGFGICRLLRKKNPPAENETLLGYDLIGMDGTAFHSFHCHGMSQELHEKFGVACNDHGLLADDTRWRELSEYMNDEKTAAEPVPWFFAQVRMVDG